MSCGSCRTCGKLFDHHYWCDRNKKSVISDRDWNGWTVPYEIPMSTIRSELDNFPPTSSGTSNKYPKRFINTERLFRPSSSGPTLYEYVYNPDQVHVTGSRYDHTKQTNNRRTTPEKGYGRIITAPDKTYQGYVRHPYVAPPGQFDNSFDRMPERVRSWQPGRDRIYTYDKKRDGIPKKSHVWQPWVERIITRVPSWDR